MVKVNGKGEEMVKVEKNLVHELLKLLKNVTSIFCQLSQSFLKDSMSLLKNL